MNYKKLELKTWKRADVFRHFIEDVRCVISVTTEVDVTDLLAMCRRCGWRFYPATLYVVARALNRREEFRIGRDEDGELIVWDEVSPAHLVFHEEDELFTHLFTEYSPDFEVFHGNVLADMELHKDKRGFEVEAPFRNTFDASCIPWLSYNTLDLHVYDSGTYLSPVMSWGKYVEKDGRMQMPLSIQIHHAVADGYHIARFYRDVAEEMALLCQKYQEEQR